MLKVKAINVSYGDAQALYDVSLRVDEHEIIAVIGPNGAGKSTILRTIAGLQRPISGSIEFLDQRIDRLAPFRIAEKGLSLVCEGRHLFSSMSVLENLEMGAYTREARKRRHDTLEWLFQLFPVLKERQGQKARTLSGGEQQMLAIGRGLMAKPKLLMLDEPSLGLSPIVTDKIFKTIEQLSNQVTILLVEQRVAGILRMSQRAYVLEEGKMFMEGEPQKLVQSDHVKKAYLGV